MIDQLAMDQSALIEAWTKALPQTLSSTDHAKVMPDAQNSRALRIHIDNDGRAAYSFDFKCTYMDSREVNVELVDVEMDGVHQDEHSDIIQSLIGDYVRHIHECAQVLHEVTHS